MSQIEIKSDVITNKEINSFKPFKKETESILNYDSIRQNEKKRKKFVNNFKYQKFSFFNFFLFEIMFFVLQIVSQENYIKLTVPNSGEQQIFSDKYALSENGFSKIKINGRTKILRDKKVSLDRPNSNVIIEWSKTITDFTYMFANIESISSITINNLLNQSNTNIAYMFYNCRNLENVVFEGGNEEIEIIDTTRMFYNCINLKSVTFKNNFQAINVSVAEMFYNCYKLNNVNNVIINSSISVINMTKMFYNCQALKSVDLSIFQSQENYYIDISYLFYNCCELESISLGNDDNKIYTNNMNHMFYNCKNLSSINLINVKLNTNIDMSYLFYNCQKLENAWNNGENLSNLVDSNMEGMFYNCSNINQINLPFNGENININMARMFYSCIRLTSISVPNNPSIFPNDMKEMFYNCINLSNIENFLDKIETNNTVDMSHLFYNCFEIKSLEFKKFENTLTRNMRGMFFGCKNLESITFTRFGTSNVEIMWEMFKGCTNLSSLDLSKFDTSKVTDMESMFEGCSSLTSLSLDAFNTSKVQYMNKMFRDCELLQILNFSNINANSVGTMHQMFYNCRSLEYLNILSMVENGQSTAEMFDETSDNFTFCIGEDENIPEIFKMLLDKNNTSRDCKIDCYEKERISIPEKKLCCKNFIYEDNCYEKCPGKTQDKYNNGTCVNFTCNGTDEYYDYEQNNCTTNYTGYYVNDSYARTIDKCHEDCLACEGKWSDDTTNCTICNISKPYIYLGNCYENCTPGFYTDGDKTICKCFDEKCELCSEESLKQNLCHSCNEGYYAIFNDSTNQGNWFNCYKDPENYYLKEITKNNKNEKYYVNCYPSCKYCISGGNKDNHQCLNCTEETPFSIKKINSKGDITYNCYENCSYFYYFDENNDYQCTDDSYCPDNYNKLISGERECVNNCTKVPGKNYEFRKVCYDSCPVGSFNETLDNYFCRITCPFEKPFEMVQEQICVNNCTIMERHYGLCKTNYIGNRSSEVQDRLFNNLQDDIIETFNYHFVNENVSIVLEETDNTYEILTTNKLENDPRTSELNLGSCADELRKYYGIAEGEPLYILKLDAKREGMQNPKVEYLVYYPLMEVRLEQLDLTICEGLGVILSFFANITGNEDLYNKNSPYYNDICYTFTSDDGTDIPLEMRQQIYADNNQSLCEEGCDFSKYNIDTGKVECSCDVKITAPLVSEIKIDKESLYNFVDITKLINFDVMKCVNLFFDSKKIPGNIGFFVFIPTFVMLFICIFVFYLKEFSLLKNEINEIVEAKKNYDYIINSGERLKYFPVYLDYLKEKGMKLPSKLRNRSISNNKPGFINQKRPPTYKVKNKLKIKIKKKVLKSRSSMATENLVQKSHLITENNDNIDNIDIPEVNKKIENKMDDTIIEEVNEKIEDHLNETNDKNAPPKKNDLIDDDSLEQNGNSTVKKNILDTTVKNENEENDFNVDKIDQYKGKFSNEEKLKIKAVLKYNDDELNAMGYKEALKKDHRSFLEFYFALLKSKHLLITLIEKRDYNSRIIKVYLFFFNFASGYAINGLFFDDNSMNNIYKQKGKFNLIEQIPQILYSWVIGYIFDIVLSYLSLSEDDILDLKQEKEIKNIDKKKDELISRLKIKFVLFFIISFLLLVLFWYYIGCFCAVYKNTQSHLLKDTLISFVTSLGYPFVICLFPAVFRIPALKKKSKANRLLFILSKIIQFF